MGYTTVTMPPSGWGNVRLLNARATHAAASGSGSVVPAPSLAPLTAPERSMTKRTTTRPAS